MKAANDRRQEENQKLQGRKPQNPRIAAQPDDERKNDREEDRSKTGGPNAGYEQKANTVDAVVATQAKRKRTGRAGKLEPLSVSPSPAINHTDKIEELPKTNKPHSAAGQTSKPAPPTSPLPSSKKRRNARKPKVKQPEIRQNTSASKKPSQELQQVGYARKSGKESGNKIATPQSKYQPQALQDPLKSEKSTSQHMQSKGKSLASEQFGGSGEQIEKESGRPPDLVQPKEQSSTINQPNKTVKPMKASIEKQVEKIQQLLEADPPKSKPAKASVRKVLPPALPIMRKTQWIENPPVLKRETKVAHPDTYSEVGSIKLTKLKAAQENGTSMRPKELPAPFDQARGTMMIDQRGESREENVPALGTSQDPRDQSQGATDHSQGSRGQSWRPRGSLQQPRGKPHEPRRGPHALVGWQPSPRIGATPVDTANGQKQESRPSARLNHWRCEPCNRTMMMHNKIEHLSGVSHSRVVQHQVAQPPQQLPLPPSVPWGLSALPPENQNNSDASQRVHMGNRRVKPKDPSEEKPSLSLVEEVKTPLPINTLHNYSPSNRLSKEGFYCEVCRYRFDHKDIHLDSVMHAQQLASHNNSEAGSQSIGKANNPPSGRFRHQARGNDGYHPMQPSGYELQSVLTQPQPFQHFENVAFGAQQGYCPGVEKYPVHLLYGERNRVVGRPAYIFEGAHITPQPIFPQQMRFPHHRQQQVHSLFQPPCSPNTSGHPQHDSARVPQLSSNQPVQRQRYTPIPQEHNPYESPTTWDHRRHAVANIDPRKHFFQRQWYPSTEEWGSQRAIPYGFMSHPSYPVTTTRWSCDVCQISIEVRNKESHLTGGPHQSRVRQLSKMVEVMQRPKPIQKLWTCAICRSVVAETETANHLLGEQHFMVVSANLAAARAWKAPRAAQDPVQSSDPTPVPVPAPVPAKIFASDSTPVPAVGKEKPNPKCKNGEDKGGGSPAKVFSSEDDEFYGLVG